MVLTLFAPYPLPKVSCAVGRQAWDGVRCTASYHSNVVLRVRLRRLRPWPKPVAIYPLVRQNGGCLVPPRDTRYPRRSSSKLAANAVSPWLKLPSPYPKP